MTNGFSTNGGGFGIGGGSGSGDGSFESILRVETQTAGGTFSAYDPVRLSSGQYVQSNATSSADAVVNGLAIGAGTADAEFSLVTSGLVVGAISGASPGQRYYLAAAGGLTTTAPTTPGQYVLEVGRAVSATDLWVDVQSASVVPTPEPGTEEFTVTFSSVDEFEALDLGVAFQAIGSHTAYGGYFPFAEDSYWWISVNGSGVDPSPAGMTGYEVALTGSGPWTGVQVATAAAAAGAGSGYVLSRTGNSIAVSGGSLDASATLAIANGRSAFGARGGGTIIGSTEVNAASSADGNSTAWIQPDPSTVPSGAFRIIGFEVRRGSNVTDPIRMAVATGGTGNGNPEGAVVQHEREMGNSGANNWHREWLAADEIVELSGGERIFIGTHGDGATSSLFAGSGIQDGLFAAGSDTLWLTDGTSGSSTPFASPVGAVANDYNFATATRIIIQEAPYQNDGNYRVIAGAVPGIHDQDNYAPGSEVDDIFVAWAIEVPDVDGIQLMDTQIQLQSYTSTADDDQMRFELWNTEGGASTFAGDTLVGLIGVTEAGQGTGWSSVQDSPIALTPGNSYRYSIKGSGAGTPGANVFNLNLGGFGTGNVGHPVYAMQGGGLEDEELEVMGTNPVNTDETALDFDPQVATASPNNANGTIETPGNIGMIALYLGKNTATFADTSP